jgi:catechol 2,3-dioxygenase-like lactoylglutathione lyase family enzyme
MKRGLQHVGLATHDMEATLAFYEEVLGFEAVVCEMIPFDDGGAIRHAFFDTGQGELIAFMECNQVRGVAPDFDAGINRGLGIQGGMIHFAFEAESVDKLAAKREALIARGVTVSEIVDHDGWCKSIYFEDPNGIQLEYCCLTRALTPDDAVPKVRAQISNKPQRRATP